MMQKWHIHKQKIDADEHILLPFGAIPIGIEPGSEEYAKDVSGDVTYRYYRPVLYLMYMILEEPE